MDDVKFGCIGVDVAGYSLNNLRSLLQENGLDTFIVNNSFLTKNKPYGKGKYLQAECRGLLSETTTLSVLSEYIRYTTDIETYFLILRTALLDITAANALVNELYYQGLIKPRKSHETN